MSQKLFSLLYTSRRAKLIEPTIDRWLGNSGATEDVEVVVAVDEDDEESRQILDCLPSWVVKVVSPMPGNCVKGWNAAAAASTGKVLIAISDDFDCPQNWVSLLKEVADPGWEDSDCCVMVSDGCLNGEALMCTLGIITRKRFERFGYFWYPGYESMYVDNDMAERAAMDGAMINATHLVFKHHHYARGGRGKDKVDGLHASHARMERGRLIFDLRKQRGFPIDVGPRAGLYSNKNIKFVAYLQSDPKPEPLVEEALWVLVNLSEFRFNH